MWTMLITAVLAINCFLAGTIWADNDYEPLGLRVVLTLVHLVLGTPIHFAYLLFNVTHKPRQWVEARTQLWFWIKWPFEKGDRYKGYDDDYYEAIERLYVKNKGKFGPFHWSTRQACKKILLLNNRQLP